MEISYEEKMQYVLEEFLDNNGSPTPQTSFKIANKLLKNNGFNSDVPFILKQLKTYGLLESSISQSNNEIYGITLKGLNVLQDGGILKHLKDIQDKDKLELKILKATGQSHMLNRLQLVITFVLALGTIVAIYLQYCTYNMEREKTKLEIQKLKTDGVIIE